MHHAYCKPPFLLGRVLGCVLSPHWETDLREGHLGVEAVGQPGAEGDRSPRFVCRMRPLSSILSQELDTIRRNLTFEFENGGCFKAAGKSYVPPWLDCFGAENSTV